MTQADEHRRDPQTFSQFCGSVVQYDKRFACILSPDFDVFPFELPGKAGSERLGNRFLCGKANSEMRRRILHFAAILSLAGLVDFFDESVSVAPDGIRNSRVFHHVDPDTKDHPKLFMRSNI